jgi:hypothetical protein
MANIMNNYKFIKILTCGLVSLTLALTSCGKGCGVGAPSDKRGAGHSEGLTRFNEGPLVLRAINITTNNQAGIHPGSRLQFEATGVFADGAEENLTDVVTWTTSNMAVVSISNALDSKGQARALSIGRCSITATFGDISGLTTLTVN